MFKFKKYYFIKIIYILKKINLFFKIMKIIKFRLVCQDIEN